MKQRVSAALLAVALAFGTVGVAAAPAEAKAKTFKNCTELNKTYKHGVGKPGAKD
ncbi:MAG: calcium-binding protein, partial [Comamonadaceae bacterium]